jgi:hypothetical protein
MSRERLTPQSVAFRGVCLIASDTENSGAVRLQALRTILEATGSIGRGSKPLTRAETVAAADMTEAEIRAELHALGVGAVSVTQQH